MINEIEGFSQIKKYCAFVLCGLIAVVMTDLSQTPLPPCANALLNCSSNFIKLLLRIFKKMLGYNRYTAWLHLRVSRQD